MNRPEPIRVRVLRFLVPMDGAGLSVASACTGTEPKGNQRSWQIYYWPWMRHFRIEHRRPDKDKPEVAYVHECHVRSWDPAEDVERPTSRKG